MNEHPTTIQFRTVNQQSGQNMAWIFPFGNFGICFYLMNYLFFFIRIAELGTTWRQPATVGICADLSRPPPTCRSLSEGRRP